MYLYIKPTQCDGMAHQGMSGDSVPLSSSPNVSGMTVAALYLSRNAFCAGQPRRRGR